MRKYKWLVIINLTLLLIYFAHAVLQKEKILQHGQLVLMELGTVDTRSLIQGDYMDLRYKIASGLGTDNIPKRGYCVVRLDSNGIASRVRLQTERTPRNPGEYLIEYTSEGYWRINIGKDAYFFQEGQREKYSHAKYGGVKIDSRGNSLLVGLYDEHRRKIE